MRPKSKTLFHFTKNQDNLRSILHNGFWPKYCLEDMGWMLPGSEWYVAFPITCFCDIPLSRIQEHVDFYGSFGIGLTKEWAARHGLNPVMYLAEDNDISSSYMEFNNHSHKLTGSDRDAAMETMRYMAAFAKPLTGYMRVNEEKCERDFYMESEWRFAPKHAGIRSFLKKEEYEDQAQLDQADLSAKEHCGLPVKPADIRYVFVKSDEEIPGIINFIQNELVEYSAEELSLLVSRVTSLESLSQDV